jgi:hypothetical protein
MVSQSLGAVGRVAIAILTLEHAIILKVHNYTEAQKR